MNALAQRPLLPVLACVRLVSNHALRQDQPLERGSVALIVLNGDALAGTFVARMDGRQFTCELPGGAVGTFLRSSRSMP